MTPLLCSDQLKLFSQKLLRRSERKKTKKIVKVDFLIESPLKSKNKKNQSTNEKSYDSEQLQRAKVRNKNVLKFGNKQFSIEMLNCMKQTVNQQQIKLLKLTSIELSNIKKYQKVVFEKGIAFSSLQSRYLPVTQLKIEQNTNTGQLVDKTQIYKVRQVTEINIQNILSVQSSHYDNSQQNDQISSFIHEESEYLEEIPLFRKESSKLLADNYENLALQYTVDHMIPSQYKDEDILNQQPLF